LIPFFLINRPFILYFIIIPPPSQNFSPLKSGAPSTQREGGEVTLPLGRGREVKVKIKLKFLPI